MRTVSAKLRQRGYDLMAQVFSRPEEDFYPEAVLRHLTRWYKAWANCSEYLTPSFETQSILQEATDILCRFKREDKRHRLLALEIAYNRLFYGPGRPLVPPYASAYIHPLGQLIMAQPAIDVLRLYREESLKISETFCDLPDHLILELAFMSFLCEQEVSADLPEKWWEKQHQFLSSHLIWWLPSFVDSLQEHASEPLYPPLARLLLYWVEADLRYLEGLLERRWSKRNKVPLSSDQPKVQQNTEQVRKIHLSINDECSFCGICTFHCQDSALQLSILEDETQLVFYPSRCSLCLICTMVCPEEILEINTEKTLEKLEEVSRSQILAKSPYMRCNNCGSTIPLPGQAYALHQLEQEGRRGLLLFLQLCEPCRGRRLIKSQLEKDRFIIR